MVALFVCLSVCMCR